MTPRIGWAVQREAEPAVWLAPYRYPDASPQANWLADRYPHVVQITHPPEPDGLPEMGSLPEGLLDPLFEHLHDAYAGLFWAGWGGFLDADLLGAAAVHDTNDWRYCVVSAVRSPGPSSVRERSPNFWWPRDHSWCTATGIDENRTLVVSANRDRLRAIHEDPRFDSELFSR